MYKVLIVDDEKIVRVALRSMIDWQAEGFEICDAVANGEQGLQAIETHRPQLIIADIRMPKMDGMVFSARAREMGFTGEIIILSNHKKFSYAVEALHHNVLDYLCKTDITPETLLKIVRKARLKLQAAPAVQTAALPSEADLDRLEQHWADPALPPATLSQGYMAVLVRARRAGGSEQAARSALKNLLPELGRHWFSRALQCSEGEVLCLLSAEQAAQYEQNAAQLCARLTQLADLYMNIEAVLVHSPQFHTTDSFLQMVEQCRQACALTMYFGFGRPIACTLLESYDQLLEDAGSWLRQTHRAAIQPAAGRLRACIQQLFASLRGRRVPPRRLAAFFVDLHKLFLADCYLWIAPHQQELLEADSRLARAVTLDEYQDAFLALADCIESHCLCITPAANKGEVVAIARLVGEMLCEKITLSLIAQRINISENYISRLFKSDTGINLITYINIRKMERARDLLCDTEMSVKEISAAVGYEDQSYFNRTFYKMFGISPTEYRRLLLSILNGQPS